MHKEEPSHKEIKEIKVSIFKHSVFALIDLFKWIMKSVSIIFIIGMIALVAIFFCAVYNPDEVMQALEIIKSIFNM